MPKKLSKNKYRKTRRYHNDFVDFPNKTIKELSKSIVLGSVRAGAERFKFNNNSVYFPLIGYQTPSVNMNDLRLRPQNFCEIELNPEIIKAEYFVGFMTSYLGRRLLENAKKGTVIPRISKKGLEEIEIPIPPIEIQEKVQTTFIRLSDLKKKVDKLGDQILLNPISNKVPVKKINQLYEVLGEMPIDERIKFLVSSKDESITLEYKEIISQSLDPDLKKNKINDKVIKTIAAFLNSRGGELLVGISEDNKSGKHNIEGINKEIDRFYKNNDSFLLAFKDVIAQRIGQQFYPFIDQSLVQVRDKYVLYVQCLPSDKAVFVDQKDFFVRTTPATDKIEGQKQMDYIMSRFK